MSVRFLERIIFFNFGFVPNAPPPIFVTLSGKIILSNWFFWNAATPISVSVFGNSIFVIPQSAKTFAPIFSSFAGSVTLVNFSSAVANMPLLPFPV